MAQQVIVVDRMISKTAKMYPQRHFAGDLSVVQIKIRFHWELRKWNEWIKVMLVKSWFHLICLYSHVHSNLGVAIKNFMNCFDEMLKNIKAERWFSQRENLRVQLKTAYIHVQYHLWIYFLHRCIILHYSWCHCSQWETIMWETISFSNTKIWLDFAIRANQPKIVPCSLITPYAR